MHRILMASALGAAVAFGGLGLTAAQAQDFTQGLKGLLNGNQQNDQSLRDAYQRGYQQGYARGRDDGARVGQLQQGQRGDYSRDQGRYVPPGNGPPSYGNDNGRYGNGNGYNNGD